MVFPKSQQPPPVSGLDTHPAEVTTPFLPQADPLPVPRLLCDLGMVLSPLWVSASLWVLCHQVTRAGSLEEACDPEGSLGPYLWPGCGQDVKVAVSGLGGL